MAFHWRTIFATLVFSVLAGLLGSRLGIQRTLELYPGPASGGINTALKQTLHGRLKLSDAQAKAIAEIEKRNELKRIQLRAEAKRATFEFARAMNETNEDLVGSPRVNTAIEQMSAASKALQEEAVLYADEVRRALTPTQRALIDEKINEVLTNIADKT